MDFATVRRWATSCSVFSRCPCESCMQIAASTGRASRKFAMSPTTSLPSWPLAASRSPPGEQRLADYPGGSDAGPAGRIPGVRDLHEVSADHLAALEHPDDLDQLRHSQPAGLGRARPRRLGRVEDVDVDRDVERIA